MFTTYVYNHYITTKFRFKVGLILKSHSNSSTCQSCNALNVDTVETHWVHAEEINGIVSSRKSS